MLSKVMVHQDTLSLLALALGVFPCAFYVVIYGVVTSRFAFYFGDPTPKLNGGFSINPLVQVESIGLLIFMTTGLGWGKWFPLKRQNFQRPVADLFTVHGGGMLAVLLVAVMFLFVASGLYRFDNEGIWISYFIWFFTYCAVLGVGFSTFQVLPLPFFACFRVLYLLLSQPMQLKLKKCVSVGTMAYVVCLWSGFFKKEIAWMVSFVLAPFCQWVGLPFAIVEYYFL